VFDDLALRPALFLAIWAAGICAGTAAVARWRIVGPGFLWVASGAALLVGAGASFAGLLAMVAGGLILAAAVAARRSGLAAWLLAAASLLYGIEAALDAHALLVVTGAMALGGVSSEMLLGHWYLVDPRLPRTALRNLAAIGIAGIALDGALLTVLGAPFGNGVLGLAFVVLATFGLVLMVGVWFSIKEKGYEGVMAATGLSYLAVLTVLGSAALGRALI